jgi:hypothetical protein
VTSIRWRPLGHFICRATIRGRTICHVERATPHGRWFAWAPGPDGERIAEARFWRRCDAKRWVECMVARGAQEQSK